MLAEQDRQADMKRFGGNIPVISDVPNVIPPYQMAA